MSAALRHLLRRTTRAAVTAGQHVLSAAVSAHHRLLVALFAAIDTGATLRIAYTDSKGVRSVRDISPHRLDPTNAGWITCRAFDWRDREDTTFRTDRMVLTVPKETPMGTRALARHLNPGDDILICGRPHTVYAVAEDATAVHVFVTSDHYAPYRFPIDELVTVTAFAPAA